MVTISIIIPCYNHGLFVREAVASVLELHDVLFEIIVVNDGSSDEYTIQVLSELEKEGIRVIHQKNSGLATARNIGVYNSKGKYILPLDADNKIKSDYVLKAIHVLDSGQGDIVYAKPEFIGENIPSRFFHPKEFDINKILLDNYIDACAIYRRVVWELTGGYDVNMPFPGHEDWEFWINSYKNGFKFKFLDEKLYYYRILVDSMIENTSKNNGYSLNHKFLINKHFDLFLYTYRSLNCYRIKKVQEENRPFRMSIKFFLSFLKKSISRL